MLYLIIAKWNHIEVLEGEGKYIFKKWLLRTYEGPGILSDIVYNTQFLTLKVSWASGKK